MKPFCILCKNPYHTVLFPIKGYTLVKCTQCNLIYITPWPDKKMLKKFYEHFEFKMGFINEALVRKDARRSLNNLKKLGLSHGQLLDLGCGPGFFLDEAVKKNWTVMGVDTSKPLTNYAQKKLKLDVLQKNINSFRSNKKFDVITLIQVIEHLTNPYTLLGKVRLLLKDSGIFCISTPNMNSLMYKVLKEKFNYLIPPEHVIYYTPTTLSALLEKSGFRVVKSITYGYAEDFGGIYRALRTKKKVKNSNLTNISGYKNSFKSSWINEKKHDFFENVIREIGYRSLDFFHQGSMIEIYAKKQ